MARLDQDFDEDEDDEPEEHRASVTSVSNEREAETPLLPPRRDGKKGSADEGTWPFVRKILAETAPTLLFTIIGLTITGELLEHVVQWRPLKEIDEFYILIPILNNLKGNLEMSLSSRLSTSAVLGELDVASTRKMIVYGTMSLLQVQAIVVSAIAAILACLLGSVITRSPTNTFARIFKATFALPPFQRPPQRPDKSRAELREFTMVLCTSMASASFSGLILSSFMCFLIITCRRFDRNPDNIAPPVASCIGDLLTLSMLGLVSSVLIRTIDTIIPFLFTLLFIIGAIFAVVFTLRNIYVEKLLSMGWIPLFGAMIISSGTGVVLEHFVTQYEGFGLLAVAISGLPDAVGCILVSRISTSLHVSAAASATATAGGGRSAKHKPRISTTIMTLLVVTLPVQLIYVTFLHVTGWMDLPWLFVVLFIFFFCVAVLVALLIANVLTHFLWRRDLDPDTYAMPIQSSLVDLSGQLLLVMCYEIARGLGADVKHTHWE